LPTVVTQRCLEQDLNPRPTDRKPKCLTVAPPPLTDSRPFVVSPCTSGCSKVEAVVGVGRKFADERGHRRPGVVHLPAPGASDPRRTETSTLGVRAAQPQDGQQSGPRPRILRVRRQRRVRLHQTAVWSQLRRAGIRLLFTMPASVVGMCLSFNFVNV